MWPWRFGVNIVVGEKIGAPNCPSTLPPRPASAARTRSRTCFHTCISGTSLQRHKYTLFVNNMMIFGKDNSPESQSKAGCSWWLSLELQSTTEVFWGSWPFIVQFHFHFCQTGHKKAKQSKMQACAKNKPHNYKWPKSDPNAVYLLPNAVYVLQCCFIAANIVWAG